MQIPQETNLAVEELRARGLFYTEPTEIELMCRLSLVDYLSNNSTIPKKQLYEWVFASGEEEKKEVDQALSDSQKEELLKILLDIKIIDPACGAGGFLIGMFYLLDDLILRLETNLGILRPSYKSKKHIIENSLYGVDILASEVEATKRNLTSCLKEGIEGAEEDYISFRIRQGDSLLQKFFELDFHPRSAARLKQPEVQKYIELINKEKDYDKRSFECDERRRNRERQFFLELISKYKNQLKEEIAAMGLKLNGNSLFPLEDDKEELIQKIEREKAEKEERLQKLLVVEQEFKQNENETFFVWDIAFPEVFEKGGFDIIIGNPPYIRQEKISGIPELSGVPSYIKLISNYKQELIDELINLYPYFFKKRKIDARSDFYVYFYFFCLSLLSPRGSFCFITSNSWLDVGFGRVLQEFLLRHSEIKMLIDNSARRSFSQALIDTVIVLLSPPKEKEEREKLARFVRFKVPFEKIVNEELGKSRALTFIKIEEIEKEEEEEEFICRVKKQEDLLNEGIDEKGQYQEGKFGRHLRTPKIFSTILERAKDKLVKLGDINRVECGFKTGANEFFYLKKLGGKGGIVRVRNKVGWEGEMEEECLKPIVNSIKELKSIKGNKDFPLSLFYVQNTPQELKEIYPLAYDYVKWGESQGYQNRPTCRSRTHWYELEKRDFSDMVLSIFYSSRYFVPLNEDFFLGANLISLFLSKFSPEDKIIVLLFLNSSLLPSLADICGRTLVGLQKLMVYEAETVDVIDPRRLSPGERKAFLDFYAQREDFLLRPIKSIFEELGFPKPNKDYSNIDVDDFSMDKLLPDRRELDEIVFSVLGLNEKEKNEFYKAVVQLVKNRLSKAKSV